MDKVVKGAGVLALQSGVNALLGTLLFMYLARVLSKAEVGIYGAATLILTVSSIVGRLGLNIVASRFIPHLYGEKNEKMAGLVTKHILYLSLGSASVLSAVFFVSSSALSILMFGDYSYSYLFQILSFALFSMILGLVFSSFVQGLQMFTRLAFILLLSQIIKVTVSITLLTWTPSVEALFLGFASFYIFLIASSLKPTINLLKKSSNCPSQSVKPLLSFGLPIIGYELVSYIYNSVDQYITLNLMGVEALGTYTVAIAASNLTLTVIGVPLSTTLTPWFSEAHGHSDATGVADTINPTSRYVSLLFIPATLGLAALSPVAINILAGQTYVEAWLPTTIMCFGVATYGFSTVITSALIAVGKTGKVMMITFIASAAGLALTLSLIEPFGILGAASAKALMYVFLLALSLHFGSKILPLSFDNRAVKGSITSSIVMAIAVYTAAFFTGFSLVLLPLYVIMGLLIYGLTLSAMRILTLKDLQFISQVVPGGKYVYHKLRRIMENSRFLSKLAKRVLNI